MLNTTQIQFLHNSITSYISTTTSIDYHATYLVLDVTSSVKYVFPLMIYIIFFDLHVKCCDVAVAQINYPCFKHNTQDSIEQARDRSHEEGSSQIFMLNVMQFGGGGFGCYLG